MYIENPFSHPQNSDSGRMEQGIIHSVFTPSHWCYGTGAGECIVGGVGVTEVLAKALPIVLPSLTTTTLELFLFFEVLSWHSILLLSIDLHVKFLPLFLTEGIGATHRFLLGVVASEVHLHASSTNGFV